MKLRLYGRPTFLFLALCISVLSSCTKKYDESLSNELINASKSGNLKLVKTFLKAGANPNSKTDGVSPLVWASYKGHLSIVKLLLEKGADINMQDKDGDTPLLASVFAGKAGVASYLVSMGASLNIKNKRGKTALSVAYERKSKAIISLLLKTGQARGVRAGDGQELVKAVEKGDYNLVQKLLKAGASPNFGEGNLTPLYAAVMNGKYDIARLLLKFGAKPDLYVMHGDTPLILAARRNNIKMAKILLDNGADINKGSSSGYGMDAVNFTPLITSAKIGHVKMVKFLIKRGADVNITARGFTYRDNPAREIVYSSALTIAEEKGHRAIAQILINAGAKRINKYSAN